MAFRSTEATIDYLLTCLEATEGKTNWEEVANKTGWYKAGKFALQAFRGIEKKYKGTVVGNQDEQAAPAPKKARKTNKMPAQMKRKLSVSENDEGDDEPAAKKAKGKVDASVAKIKKEGDDAN